MPLSRMYAITVLFVASGIFNQPVLASTYTMEQAIETAIAVDPWLRGSLQRQAGLEAKSREQASYANPMISVDLINLPTDTLQFSQEASTQIKVGVKQVFPRGDTRSLKKQRLDQLSKMQPEARLDRVAQVAVIVSHLWLEVFRNERTIQLIEKNRGLFEHLVDVSQSNYTTAAGTARQQDLVRAQLELTRIEDRLIRLHQQRDIALTKLGEWLEEPSVSIVFHGEGDVVLPLSAQQLDSKVGGRQVLKTDPTLSRMLRQHPLIKSIDWKLHAFSSDIKIAQQSYKPQWGVNASYGIRDKSPTGEERPDFFSVGVSIDVPLFGTNRQDSSVRSAKAEYQAIKTERALALRQLQSNYQAVEAAYFRLKQRQVLFDSRLLKEIAQQAEASLSAYTNDDGDFAEVVRARIAELNTQIEAVNIDVDIQKNLAQLNYFYAGLTPLKPFQSQEKPLGLNSGTIENRTAR